jgi:hypothetical protein
MNFYVQMSSQELFRPVQGVLLSLPVQSEMNNDAVARSSAIKRFALTRNAYNAVDETSKHCVYNANFRVGC